MNDVPDHTEQHELLKRFSSGGSYYFRKTYRDQMGESALSRSNSAPTAACPQDWSR